MRRRRLGRGFAKLAVNQQRRFWIMVIVMRVSGDNGNKIKRYAVV